MVSIQNVSWDKLKSLRILEPFYSRQGCHAGILSARLHRNENKILLDVRGSPKRKEAKQIGF